MKKMKKIFAMLLSLAMVLGMSMTTLAAPKESATITVNDAEDATFLMVQVIAPDRTTDTGWAFVNGAGAAYTAALKVQNEQDAIWKLIKFANSNATVPEETVAATAGEINIALSNVTGHTTFTNGSSVTSAGVYAIRATEEGFTYNNMAAYVGFDVVGEHEYPSLVDTVLTAKKTPTTVVKDNTDTDDVVAVGDIITYTVEAYVPFINPTDTDKTFFIYDSITGATYDLEDATVMLGVEDITATYPIELNDDETGFSIELSNLIDDANSKAGQKITVTYKAVVTGVTVNNTASAGHEGGSQFGSITTNTYTGQITLTKYGEDTTVTLAGAGFKVTKDGATTALKFTQDKDEAGKVIEGSYTYDPTNGTIEEVFTGANGTLVIKGLNVGKYHFEETTAPTGYSINGDGADAELKLADGATGATATLTATTSLNNTKLSKLPGTGGIGTTIFTIGGCLIMIAAAALFFASRKKSSK